MVRKNILKWRGGGGLQENDPQGILRLCRKMVGLIIKCGGGGYGLYIYAFAGNG